MPTVQPTAPTQSRVTYTDPHPAGRSRTALVSAALALGSAAVIAFLAWRPGPPRDDFTYASFALVRDEAWWGYLLDFLGLTVSSVALAIAVCLLVRGRGAAWATVGAPMVALGGTLFGAVPFTFAVIGWYITDPAAVPVEQGTALMAWVADNMGHLAGPQIVGFLFWNVGLLLLCTALWRGRAVPRWLPIATAVLVVGQFGPLPGRSIDVAQGLLMASFVAIAWYTLRSVQTSFEPAP